MEAQRSKERPELPKEHLQQDSEPAELRHERQQVGNSRVEGSPSLRGCEDSQALSTQVNDQPQADEADSHQVLLYFL